MFHDVAKLAVYNARRYEKNSETGEYRLVDEELLRSFHFLIDCGADLNLKADS